MSIQIFYKLHQSIPNDQLLFFNEALLACPLKENVWAVHLRVSIIAQHTLICGSGSSNWFRTSDAPSADCMVMLIELPSIPWSIFFGFESAQFFNFDQKHYILIIARKEIWTHRATVEICHERPCTYMNSGKTNNIGRQTLITHTIFDSSAVNIYWLQLYI